MLSFILFLIALICAYYWRKSYRGAIQLAELYQQYAILAEFYQYLLLTLAERQHYTEEDYQKLVKGLYTLDQWSFTNHDVKEHNKKWEAICKALNVTVRYTDFMGNKWVSEEVMPVIAAKLYHDRHAFLQFVENVERIRKRS